MGKTVGIIGCGVVGCAIGRAVRKAGYRITGLASRTRESVEAAQAFIGEGSAKPPHEAADADIVFIATPDSAIQAVCEEIVAAGGFRSGGVVFHCSGALTADVLTAARECGAVVGSLHPLQSFAASEQAAQSLRGIYFAFQGDDAAAPIAEEIVNALSGRLFRIPAEAKALYHAASSVASNYLVAVADMAVALLAKSGVPEERCLEALLPLIRGSVQNLEKLGLPEALTGPMARGDVATVQRQMESLRKSAPEFLPAFCRLGLLALDLARRKGKIAQCQAGEMRRLLQQTTDDRQTPDCGMLPKK